MTTFSEELTLIEPAIVQLHQLHADFDKQLRDNPAYIPFNSKKVTVRKLLSDPQLSQSLFLYHQALQLNNQFVTAFKQITVPNQVQYRYRIKLTNTLTAKLKWYARKSSDFPVNKSLNDLLGARLIVDGLRCFEDELLDYFLSASGYGVRRGYIRDDQQYHGVHLYLSDSNSELPWEIQLWDAKDQSRNLEAHARHEAIERGERA